MLTSTDRLGKLATIPVVVQMVNKANATPVIRRAMHKVIGVHAERRLPPFAPKRFARVAPASTAWPVRDGERTPGKVAIFSTCYVNYNEPGIGLDLIRVLEHNEIPHVLVDKEACCGMPKLELGDLDSVERLKNANIPALARFAARRLRHSDRGALLHADVQERAAVDFPGGRRCKSRGRERCSIRSNI